MLICIEKTMAPIEQKRVLDQRQRFQYAAGLFGLMLPLSTFNAFSYNYVIYVIGLDELLASLGTFIGLVCFALGGVYFGHLTDKIKPTKIGRRRPFIVIGAPLFAIAFVMLWVFPVKCSFSGEVNWPVAIYYWAICIIFCTLYMFVWSPYMAMLPEISTDEENRIAITSTQGLLNMIATVVGLLLPFILLSGVEDPRSALFHLQDGGRELALQMQSLSILFSMASVVMLYITAYYIKEPFLEECQDESISKDDLPEECIVTEKSFKEQLQDVFKPFKNHEFKWWSYTNFTLNFGMRIPMTILMGMLMYVLELEGIAMIIFLVAVLPFVAIGFNVWNNISKKQGLKKTLTTLLGLLTIFMGFGAFLLINMVWGLKIAVGFAIVVILVSCLIALYILPNAIVSKIIDLEIEDQIEKNGPFEDINDRYKFAGKFFGANALILNLSGASAFILIGMLLDKEDPFIITLMLPITGIFMLMAFFFARPINLRRGKVIDVKIDDEETEDSE